MNGQGPRPPSRDLVRTAVLLGVPAVAVGSLFLWTVAARRYAFPIGYDTPKYIWRTNLVGSQGLAALKASAPPPFRVNADRPGFPVLVCLLSSVLHVSVIRVTQVLPAVMAVAVALGAGVIGRSAAGEPDWAFPVFAVVAGASANIARMAAPGYDDNLVLSGVIVAGAALALLAAERRRGTLGALALLASGVLIHWIFAAYFLAVLAGVAAVTAPGSFRRWRAGEPWTDTPAGRLVAVIGGAAAVGGAAFVALAAGEPSPPKLPGESFRTKLEADVPRYVFAASAPAAAAGVAAMAGLDPAGAGGDDGRRRARWRALALFVVWAGAGAAAVVLLHLGVAIPAHRLVAFGLGLPLLAAAGICGVSRLVARSIPRVGVMVAVAVVLATTSGFAIIGFRAWTPGHPWMPKAQVAQAAEAGRVLLDRTIVSADRPIVFLVDLGGQTPLSSTALAFHVIRAGLPPSLIPRTLVYLGDPETYLQGRPTLRSSPATFNQASLRHWPSVRAALPNDPVAVLMPSINRGFASAVAAHPDWQLEQAVAIVGGPEHRTLGMGPTAPTPPPLSPPGTVRLVLVAVAVLALLVVAGIGWSILLSPDDWLVRAALAPAFGVGVVVLGGVLAARAGVTPGGGAATVVWFVLSGAGWAAAAVAVRRRSTLSSPGPPPR